MTLHSLHNVEFFLSSAIGLNSPINSRRLLDDIDFISLYMLLNISNYYGARWFCSGTFHFLSCDKKIDMWQYIWKRIFVWMVFWDKRLIAVVLVLFQLLETLLYSAVLFISVCSKRKINDVVMHEYVKENHLAIKSPWEVFKFYKLWSMLFSRDNTLCLNLFYS